MALSLFQSTLGRIAALPPNAFTLNEQGVRQRMRETAAFCEIVRSSVAPPFDAVRSLCCYWHALCSGSTKYEVLAAIAPPGAMCPSPHLRISGLQGDEVKFGGAHFARPRFSLPRKCHH
jgi:hypothetical protein